MSQQDSTPLQLARKLVALLLGLALILPGTLAAQTFESMSGRTIESVEVHGLESLSEETILFYLGLAEGETLDKQALNEKIKDLWSRQLIDDIQVEAFPAADGGIRVVVTIDERPRLRSVDYEGLKRVNRADVTDRILADNIQVMEQSPLSIGEIERVTRVIEELYKEKGYRFAEARYTLEETSPNEYRVVFTVDEGNRVRIADVEFTGNDVFRDLRLQWAMKKTRETNLINRLLKKDIYNPAKFEEDLERVRDLYRKKGYKNVALGEPVIEVVTKNPDAKKKKNLKRRMYIEIPVYEGERWRLGEITIAGNERYSDQQMLAAFQHKPGSWLKSKKIDEAIEKINEFYQNSGFIFAEIDTELTERPDEANVADLTVKVTENDQYTVRRIEFDGNTRTKDKVLRRELRVQEGYLMNTGALRNSVFKINQLGYFQLDQEDPVQIDVNSEDKKVDLVFQGEEADRTELQFGGGWSETFGFEGQFGLRTQNFLGRGETLSAQFQRGRFRDVADLSYFVPWFLDEPQQIGLRAFSQDFSFDLGTQDVEQKQTGAVLTYGRSLSLFQTLSFAYTFSQRDDAFPGTTDSDGDGFPDLVTIERDFVSLRPNWTFDSRDSRLEPTRGRRMTASVEFAGGFLGGDTELIKPELAFSWFKPVTRTPTLGVFAVNVAGGYLDLKQTTRSSPLERFYLGGENSIRGHAFRSIFVRNEDGTRRPDPNPLIGIPLGGDKFLLANIEYHFVLGGPLRLIAFFDAGNVFAEDQSVDLLNLRSTAGIEMRIRVPVFGAPLRFIYAVNTDPLPDTVPVRDQDDFESFQFSIGTNF